MSDAPIIEQTSSSESHFELAGIFAVFLAQLTMSTALQQKADETMNAQQQAIQDYVDGQNQEEPEAETPPEPEPIDAYPFVEVPTGTTVKVLPDGGKLFSLPTGDMLRANADNSIVHTGEDGGSQLLEIAKAGKITLPDGQELELVQEAITVTQELVGIEGLPFDIEPLQVAPGRYTILLPDGTRIDISHPDRMATIINPIGTLVLLSLARIEGVGEIVESRLVPGGAKGFSALESGHKGVVEVNGIIHLALSEGLDLVIRFPEEVDENTVSSNEPETFQCGKHS